LRYFYEPYAHALAKNLVIILPPWIRHEPIKDNWRGGPWDRIIQAQALGHIGQHRPRVIDDHF